MSESEGYAVYIAPRLIFSGKLIRSMQYRRNRRRNRQKAKINHSISLKLKDSYKKMEENKKCRECLYFKEKTCDCIFGNITPFSMIITLAFECSYSDYFKDIILQYKKRDMKIE